MSGSEHGSSPVAGVPSANPARSRRERTERGPVAELEGPVWERPSEGSAAALAARAQPLPCLARGSLEAEPLRAAGMARPHAHPRVWGRPLGEHWGQAACGAHSRDRARTQGRGLPTSVPGSAQPCPDPLGPGQHLPCRGPALGSLRVGEGCASSKCRPHLVALSRLGKGSTPWPTVSCQGCRL